MRLGRPSNAVYDDRGLLYVRMGDPDEVAIHGGGECIEPNVSWAYDRPGGFRVYHLSPLGGTDDWYLLENLAMVYRCGAWDRNPMVAKDSVRNPAKGPNPKIATRRIATMISCSARLIATMPRQIM